MIAIQTLIMDMAVRIQNRRKSRKEKVVVFAFPVHLGLQKMRKFEEPDIDWNGTEKEDVGEDDYIIIQSNCEN